MNNVHDDKMRMTSCDTCPGLLIAGLAGDLELQCNWSWIYWGAANAIQCNAIQISAMQYNAMLCNAMPCNATGSGSIGGMSSWTPPVNWSPNKIAAHPPPARASSMNHHASTTVHTFEHILNTVYYTVLHTVLQETVRLEFEFEFANITKHSISNYNCDHWAVLRQLSRHLLVFE